MRFWAWLQSLHRIFLFADILFVQLCSMNVAQSPQPKNIVRAAIKGQSRVHHEFFSIFDDFGPNLPIFRQFLMYISLERQYNLLSSLNSNRLNHFQTDNTLFCTFYPKFGSFQGDFRGFGSYLTTEFQPFLGHLNP